jgi:hypothetical protein
VADFQRKAHACWSTEIHIQPIAVDDLVTVIGRVLRVDHPLSEVDGMGTIESQMQVEIDNFLNESMPLDDSDDRFAKVAPFVFGAIAGLARQIDLLREELVANDVDVSM